MIDFNLRCLSHFFFGTVIRTRDKKKLEFGFFSTQKKEDFIVSKAFRSILGPTRAPMQGVSKFYSLTWCKVAEGRKRHSCVISVISALGVSGWLIKSPSRFFPRKKTGSHITGAGWIFVPVWMVSEKCLHLPLSTPKPLSPYRASTTITLFPQAITKLL